MQQQEKAKPKPKLIDPRQPRFGQAITGTLALLAFILQWPEVVLALAVILGFASTLGPRFNVYVYLYKAFKSAVRLGPPKELEEPWPPRFANLMGFIFLGAASIAWYAFDARFVAGTLTLIVAALALLATTTGLCVGCELFVVFRRFATKGRVPSKIVVKREVPA
jgi:hypothetical protein